MSSAKWRPFCLGLSVLERKSAQSEDSEQIHVHKGERFFCFNDVFTDTLMP